jgi:DNA-binding transcriptional LysR family regulator
VVDEEPDLNLLIALRALLEEANVTRAGERVGIGQSTMSSALSRLRAVFHDELLVRVGRDYELTPLARQLLPQVQLTLPLVAAALGQTEPFDTATSRRRFTMEMTDYAALELRPLLDLASAEAPGISVELSKLDVIPTEGNRDLLVHDFVVAPPAIGIDLDGIELFRDEYVVVADRDNPVVASGEISAEDFAASPYVRCEFGHAHIIPVERRMRELDLWPAVRVTTSTLLSVPLVVRGTRLIGIVPRRLAQRNAAVTGTVIVPTPFAPVELIERLWWHPSRAHDPAHTWFRGLVARARDSGLFVV